MEEVLGEEFRVCRAAVNLDLNPRLGEKGQCFPQATESRGRKWEDFPGGPVVKTPGRGFDPRSEN